MFFSAAKLLKQPYGIIVAAACTLFFFSCTSVRNYPVNRPFVYETGIHLEGKFSTDEKKQLLGQLEQQLHDSLAVRKVNKFIFIRSLKNPPAFDSLNAEKTIGFMRTMLNSLGYYRDSIGYKVQIDTLNDQLRTRVDFTVYNAQLFRVDSISYNMLKDSADETVISPARDTLQQLTNESLGAALLRKGDAFSTPVLAQEIGRLTDVYRNNGYLRFSSEEMLVVWDTVGLALIRPTLDPIEQAAQLEELRRRRANPIVDVEFRLRTSPDTSRHTRYYIGEVRVFPDLTSDTALYYPVHDTVRGYEFISYRQEFRPQKLVDNIYLQEGALYRQSNFLKTQNKFNSLTSWRLVNITPVARPGQDTVDFDIKLTPARKYQFSANLEGSRNQSALAQEGNLLGLGANFSLQNRNFARGANLAVTNLRYGIELNASNREIPIQTHQYSLSNTIQFPRAFLLFRNSENVRTVFGLNLAYTDRVKYFTVQSINTSLGSEKSWDNKLLGVRFPNIEYNYLNRQDSLIKLIERNRSYEYIFNDGLILSTIVNFSIAGGSSRKNVTNRQSYSLEISGLGPTNAFRSRFLDSNLYRFAKFDFEFRETKRIRRSALAWRAFVGVGYEFPSNFNRNSQYLPFFRQYYGGGPNSMRAWGVRRLGPGSTVRGFGLTEAPDRFGDMRIEVNGEYRFFIADIYGFIVNGALFTDIGNVWFLRKNEDFPNGEFNPSRLWKDIAIGAGTGMRIDFGFLKLRLDYAYKVKDPSPDTLEAQNKWFYKWELLGGQFQLGIDYPF